MEADFSGYATKAGLKCTDGRTIMPNAFQHQDGQKVPLVWQHGHGDVNNVLGYAILEHRDDGVYAHGFFNNSPQGQAAKIMVQHGDIDSLSIFANKLVERGKEVLHGAIRELSLVLSGANPGAKIDFVAVQHSDGDVTVLDDEAVIYTGLSLEHSKTEVEVDEEEEEEEEEVEHADSDKTVEEIYNTLSPEQKDVVHFMIGAALEAADDDDEAEHSDSAGSDTTEGDLIHKEGTEMSRNVFEQNGTADGGKSLTHDDLVTIVDLAKKGSGSFMEAVIQHAEEAEYGVTDIELLFPEAKNLENTPDFIARRMEWVSKVLGSVKASPFAKVKSVHADITADEARAKGYIKGTLKKEEVIKMLRRTTSPTTIYKKQKLDRDDILDITDMDVVAWLKAEMRLMIEEELARAILVGDGRDSLDEDKIKDPEGASDGVGIRSILHDHELYSIKVELPANSTPKETVKGLVRARTKFRGSGKPTLFCSDNFLTDVMLEEDKFGRPLYETEQSLADKLRVSEIVTVDLIDEHDSLFAIMVNLADYTVGSNRGGQLTSFEDFDIDFNQHKYLQETRLSGGLTKPYSAIVVSRELGTAVEELDAPSFDGETDTITIPTVTGVTYLINDEPVTGDVVIEETTEVVATADEGYYFPAGTTTSWTFTV